MDERAPRETTRETHTLTTHSTSGHGGIYALLIVVVLLLVGGFIFLSGGLGDEDTGPDIDIEVPAPEGGIDVEAPEIPGSGGGEG